MNNRELAEKEFEMADIKNSEKKIEKLQQLASQYKDYLLQKQLATLAINTFKDALKDSGFTINDVITALTLGGKDSLAKMVIEKTADAIGGNNE